MKYERKINGLVASAAVLLMITALFAFVTRGAFAVNSSELDYTFETTPIESIKLTRVGSGEVRPRDSFEVNFEVTPWYTTTAEVYFDVLPSEAAAVVEVSGIEVKGGKAVGKATIKAADDAIVGSTFDVIAGADGVVSEKLTYTVGRIPVNGLKLSLDGSDDKLHVGKTRSLNCEFSPYASVQDLRFELSGSGMKYIESFDEESMTIKAKSDIAVLDVNSTVTVTAYSVDNPNAFDSVTLTLFMPTTVVDVSASTPLNRVAFDGKPLAVAKSAYGDTVELHTLVNGVRASGLNYVIVKGQEYVENGMVRPDGTFVIRPTAAWSEEMKVPRAEIKIRAAYSDGFDEITISVYVPVERIEFKSDAPDTAENFRSYDMSAEALPKYATMLSDNLSPFRYSLDGIGADIAEIDCGGLMTLKKFLTSKGSVIGYSASLDGAWEDVDASPLTHDVTIVPVYASGFKSVKILKDGESINDYGVRILPSDSLAVEVEYVEDNVTDVDFGISENSGMLSTDGASINIAPLADMEADNPFIYLSVNYDCGGNKFSQTMSISIYVPALGAEIADSVFKRDEQLNLNGLVTVNGHGFASNKNIEWGEPVVVGSSSVSASCTDGILKIDSCATADTVVRVPYRANDSENFQYKEFTVAALDGNFALTYGETFNALDSRRYAIDITAPQLEEGQSVDLILRYKGFGGAENFGLSYSVSCTNNAELRQKSSASDSDRFTLTAAAGQSGRDNKIEYAITIIDGNARYCVKTAAFSNPSSADKVFTVNSIAVFNRISGDIGVLNDKVRIGDIFNVSNWDALATFDEKDLRLSVNGKAIDDWKMIDSSGAFILKISAVQKYNGQDIVWSSEVTYSVIYYKDGGNVRLKIYKKNYSTITIEGSDTIKKDNYTLTGWATSAEANRLSNYTFGSNYSGNTDLTLWACWLTTAKDNKIGDINYLGSNNKCYYNLKMASDSVDGDNYNYRNFNLRLVGDSCIRKFYTTFHYKITFSLYKGGTVIATKNIDFTITKQGQVPGNTHAIFNENDLRGEGDYRVDWSGVIESNVKDPKGGSYSFKVNYC